MPCATAVCLVCRYFAACFNVSISWLVGGMHKACGLAHGQCTLDMFLERVFWNGASTLKQHFVLPKNGSKYYLKYTFLVFPVLGIFGLGTSLVYTTCGVAFVASVTGARWRCPKTLHAHKHCTHVIQNNNLLLQIASNKHARVQRGMKGKA